MRFFNQRSLEFSLYIINWSAQSLFSIVLDFWQSLRNFYRSTARRAENLSPKGFLIALSNPLQIQKNNGYSRCCTHYLARCKGTGQAAFSGCSTFGNRFWLFIDLLLDGRKTFRFPCRNNKREAIPLESLLFYGALQGCRDDDFLRVLDFWQSLRNFYRLAARRAKNSPPDCFLNARSNPLQIKKIMGTADAVPIIWYECS